MKKLLFLLTLVFILTSCKKGDSGNSSNTPSIVGKWKQSSVLSVTYTAKGEEVSRFLNSNPNQYGTYYEFTSSGSLTVTVNYTNPPATLTIYSYAFTNSNNSIVLTHSSTSTTSDFAFVDNNTMTLTDHAAGIGNTNTTASTTTYIRQ